MRFFLARLRLDTLLPCNDARSAISSASVFFAVYGRRQAPRKPPGALFDHLNQKCRFRLVGLKTRHRMLEEVLIEFVYEINH